MNELNETQKILLDTITKFAKIKIEQRAVQADEKQEFQQATFHELGELGLLGITVPEQYNGSGAGAQEAIMVIRKISEHCASTGLSYGAHAILCANNINENGNEAQKKKYLPKLCSGEWIGGMAITEPGSGSDTASITTSAVRQKDCYILNGTKMFITNGPTGQVFVVYAKTIQDAGYAGISSFIIESSFEGFSVGKKLDKMGMRGSPTSELILDNCIVPVDNLLGTENKGFHQLMACFDIERTVLSGISLGIIDRCLEEALKYAPQRKQFGKSISDYQLIQAKLADMYIWQQTAALLIYKAAKIIDSRKKATIESAAAKVYASEASVKAADHAIQILGGYGYMKEYIVERLARDAKLLDIGAGTSEIQRLIIARELLKNF